MSLTDHVPKNALIASSFWGLVSPISRGSLGLFMLMLILAASCATSSATTSDTTRAPNAPNRTLMGLEDDPIDVWSAWTPMAQVDSVPTSFKEQALAFDFWRIDDEPFRQQAWESTFTVLSILRQQALEDEAITSAITLLMSTFDPAYPNTEVDVTFVLDKNHGSWEGVLVRLWMPYEQTTIGTSLFLRRLSDGRPSPEDITIWGITGFEENRGFMATLEREGSLFITSDMEGQSPPHQANLSRAVFALLETSLWTPLTGNAYVEARMEEDPKPTPQGFEAAAGLDLREREIEEMFTDSVFPPRIRDLFDL